MRSSSTSAAPLSSEVAALVLSGAGADDTEEGGDAVVMPVVDEAVVVEADEAEDERELVAVRTVCDAILDRLAGMEVVIWEPEYTAPPPLFAAAAFVTPFWPLHCALLKSMLRVRNIR